ncbi:MmcQ/YjbR family DNA-binding protein [Rhodophyticola sp. CCM32]|uniref:MmcQ/YjbR family DNA-binding protein n=1 Tax=Rhodophyticola sp. CCM32 TaxID=2916397 RepID=UPI00107F2B39|nr:MmcQ/YjbR family DNA-binding protein [Rhodophyticola sp. CCM32]QBY01580.1 MmcQ/YjbR family DNA-binding protein [Rhodophyticola sp. CCM32]
MLARVAPIAAALPGAVFADGADELRSWKVGGKMFACFGDNTPGVSVKTPDTETAAMLIDAGVATVARYFHKSWVRLPEDVAEGELRHRIQVSYDLVRKGLPAKLRNALPARTED